VPFCVFLIAATALGLCGCATVRQAREAQSKAHVPPGERTVTAEEAGLNDNATLMLDRALELALTNHPAMTQARQNVLAAIAGVRQARSAFWPAVGGTVHYRQATANTEVAPMEATFDDSYGGALSLDFLLYDFGKTPAMVRQALAQQVAATEELRATRSTLVREVRVAYLDLCRAIELLQVKEEAERQFKLRLEQVTAFVEVGRRIRYDLTKAEVDLGNARLELINARNTLYAARATLNRRLGLAEETSYQVAPEDLAPVHEVIEELAAIARRQHPGIRALQAKENVASAAVDEAIADLYPSLRLQADYSLSGGGFPLVSNASGALRAAFSLFTGWLKTARIQRAAAQLRAARSQVADREQLIYLDLSLALSQLKTARQRFSLTELVLRQARESVELVASQYRLGKASAVELTDAQVSLYNAQAGHVNARFDCQTATAQIRYALGEE
jgi:TolC family type I secretion outer membrane protein